MKRSIITLFILLGSLTIYAQDNYFRHNGFADVYLRCLSRGEGGRAIVHGTDNMLTLNHAGDFTGGTKVDSKLFVYGKLHLMKDSLLYSGSGLYVSPPRGSRRNSILHLLPGSTDAVNGKTTSALAMYYSTDIDTYIKNVHISSFGYTFFNGGNVGIGTDLPEYKLHVFGDICVGDQKVPLVEGEGSKLNFGGTFHNTDYMFIAKYLRGENLSDLRVSIGDDVVGDDRFVVGNTRQNVWKSWLSVCNNGNVGIGVEHPTSKLEVKGTVRAQKVQIEATGWADFVFDKEYKLPALSEVETHINEHKHLPGIPSEKEVLEGGIDIAQIQAKLLQKVEELTLYVIAQEKKAATQDKRLEQQGQLINRLLEELNKSQK